MDEKYTFINPYNFIPLGEKCTREKDKNKNTYSGYLECELETLTPLIMIDTSKAKNEFDHICFKETFMLKNTPAIPGSELRGMIRNKFETLTNSCMSNSEENLAFYGRYNGNMRNPGLLDFSDPKNPKLYKCKKYEVLEYDKGKLNGKITGDCICFTTKKDFSKKNSRIYFKNIDDKSTRFGYVKIGEKLKEKEVIHIFESTGIEVEASNRFDFVKMYKEVCEIYYKNLSKNHKSQTDNDLKPVWYEKVNDYVYFSLGQNGQTKFNRKQKDLMNPDFLPCKDSDNLCEACQLFGTIQKGVIKGGKIRFEDAYLVSETKDYYATKDPIALEVLDNPKHNNALFYMRLYDRNHNLIDDMTYLNWNVDFSSKFSFKGNKTYLIPDDYISIRGRKEYWHHIPSLTKQTETTSVNKSVKPLKTGLKYQFKIYFDEITQLQLEHLNLSVSLENESSYAHKLGYAKPLGFGSVKIRVNRICYKEVKYNNGMFKYQLKEYLPKCYTLKDTFTSLTNEQLSAIEHMYDFNYISKENVKVDYPRNAENEPSFKWFSDNKKGASNILPFADAEYDALVLSSKQRKENYAPKNNDRYKK